MQEFTCLLIDDDVDDHELMIELIKGISPAVRCFTAITGKDALSQLLEGKVKPDLIFLDLNMPLMNGKQFLIEFNKRSQFSNIPVIILSTSVNKENISETLQLGARDFITKPYNLTDWENSLRKVFQNFLGLS
jgi:CheY-like chemotaxis protein